ncbi:ABC transporter substrate-binding protein [Yinghuangia seranimata]|uniref:ABC transporter substrate-binding protein n=1 Tax=Yinghuangia seranimata TaxID=408067 RepID=UPI00248CE6A6|nr:ABC transporter substrate-binding protein [Yinghuangia seranimata]MDI2132100.1 ABC transporter substrate-binding protein [Yinghuangia seranimata]
MRRVSRKWSAGAGVAAAFALVAACTTGGTGSGSGSGGASGSGGGDAVVRTAFTSDPKSFDPAKGDNLNDYLSARLLYDTLVRRDDGGVLVPGLATSWSSTATSVDLTVRGDAKCSDGTPLTASVVARSLTYFSAPETKAPAAKQVFGTGKVAVTGDDAAAKVHIELDHPWADVLFGLAMPQTGIVCDAGLKDPAGMAAGKAPGTGPFTLQDAKRGASYTFARRADYTWGPRFAVMPQGKPPASLVASVVGNESTAANELQTGALDHAALTGPDLDRFGSDWASTTLSSSNQFVVYNEREGHPGADPQVRQAVAALIDRTAYNNASTRGKGALLTSISDETSPCVLKQPYKYEGMDAATAKSVLNGRKIRVLGLNVISNGAGTAYLQAILKDAGADVELRNVDLATWASEFIGNQGQWDLGVMVNINLSATMTTPGSFMTGDSPPKGRNIGGTGNADYDREFLAALGTTDPAQHCAHWEAAQTALIKRYDTVPLSTVPQKNVYAKRISAVTPGGYSDLALLWVKG